MEGTGGKWWVLLDLGWGVGEALRGGWAGGAGAGPLSLTPWSNPLFDSQS